jgi:hypothetical protein
MAMFNSFLYVYQRVISTIQYFYSKCGTGTPSLADTCSHLKTIRMNGFPESGSHNLRSPIQTKIIYGYQILVYNMVSILAW